MQLWMAIISAQVSRWSIKIPRRATGLLSEVSMLTIDSLAKSMTTSLRISLNCLSSRGPPQPTSLVGLHVPEEMSRDCVEGFMQHCGRLGSLPQ